MAPKSPRNKTQNKNVIDPRLGRAAENAVTPTVNYDEVQAEEVEVLKAIYMDDFEDVETRTAWSKTTDRSFKLRLRAFSDEDSFVTLAATLTATYPKSLPILNVTGLDTFHERTKNAIRGIVNERPRQLSNEVMIHAIASEIQDVLEDAVQARQQGTLPSLEDERANAEEAAQALAKVAEEEDARRIREELEEEDRVLKQMVEEEISRRDRKKGSKAAAEAKLPVSSSSAEQIVFDQPAEIRTERDTLTFGSVSIVSNILTDQGAQIFLAKPDTGQSLQAPLVVVKRGTIQRSREELMEIESFLELARKLRHNSVLVTYAFRMDKLDSNQSQLTICCEYADRGSLQSLMEMSTLHARKARQYMTEILEGLDFLHHNGISHGNLTSKTVLLSGNPSPSIRLAEYGVGRLETPAKSNVSSRWQSPEPTTAPQQTLRKSDIWNAGIILCQLFVDVKVASENVSPQAMMSRLNFTDSFDDLIQKMFSIDPKKRPSAFELLPAEFLRTDASALEPKPGLNSDRLPSRQSNAAYSPGNHRSRHNSSNFMESTSRYATDFAEVGRLGKGGFGEVVKARNKLDGGVYAVKKIKQTQQLLDKILSEVMLLNRLNHPYVVRYYSTWVENDYSGLQHEDIVSTTDDMTDTNDIDGASSDSSQVEFTYASTGGLDFVSSNGYPNIEFGHDSDGEGDVSTEGDATVSDEGGTDNALALDGAVASSSRRGISTDDLIIKRSRSDSRRVPAVLYIQMEYCERQTLRDIVRRGMTVDDSWRYIRQITEGLAHIHNHGIIHRDLKPDNIFMDVAGNPKIGDFGLATTGQYNAVGKALMSGGIGSGDMTRSIGTALYIAPELKSGSSTPYNDKVDMYSLGIMFFEMSEAFSTAMERIHAIQTIREKVHELPASYRADGEKAAQGRLVSCLISHKPSERPSSTELLRSDILPLKIEDETIRQALSGLSDSRSPYHQKMMSALFSHEGASSIRVKALAWDAKSHGLAEETRRVRFRGIARQTIETIFKKHGAEESRRESIFPRSGFYTNANVVQLLDASSNMLQLPYDLILPHARQLAQHVPEVKKTYCFGHAYRDAFTGGPPRTSEEVDFDIATIKTDGEPDFDDAEVIKVMDEIVMTLPYFGSASSLCFHVNHGGLLDAILEHSRVSGAQQAAVKETLSRLGFHQWNWSKVRADLRKFGLSDTTLEDLEQFDFRDVPEKAFSKLQTIFGNTNAHSRLKIDEVIVTLRKTIGILVQLNLQHRLYVAPLASVNAKFYDGAMLFQCVLERKGNRTVIAAGGRYDKLIQMHRSVDGHNGARGAVGVSIGLDPIIAHMIRNAGDGHNETFLRDQNKQNHKTAQTSKRCEVLIIASGTEGARVVGIKMLNSLWSNDIAAELGPESQTQFPESQYNYIITIRHEASPTVRFKNTNGESEETDIPLTSLVSHIHQEMRERESTKARMPAFHRQSSHQDGDRKGNVHVLMAQHRSKKSNKYHIVEAAQNRWTEKIDGWKDAPILAIEARDEVLDSIRDTKLSDVESWRRVVQSVPLTERQYLQQTQDILSRWRKNWQDGVGQREACVFNFRTGHCVYYDLGL